MHVVQEFFAQLGVLGHSNVLCNAVKANANPVDSGTSSCEQLRGHCDGDVMWMVVIYMHIIL